MAESDSVTKPTLPEAKKPCRELLQPFLYNVYIAHSLEDSTFVSGSEVSLFEILEDKFNIKCFPRHLKGDNIPIKSRIDEGVWSSEKCLILMTDSYRAEPSSHYEIQQIHDKAKRFSNDTVIVGWFKSDQKEEDIQKERCDFSSYRHFYYTDLNNLGQLCMDDNQMSQLVHSIIQAPKISLACLPKVNVGYGAATGYYYGYLRLVLPGFSQRIHKRALAYEKSVPGVTDRTISKMIIILPHSCLCPPEIPDEKKRITNVKELLVTRKATRAGSIERPYNCSGYKLVNETTQEVFYFAGELATPLLTMYESCHYGLIGMTLPQLYRERDAFCFTLQQILNHPESRECNNQYRLVMWDDKKSANDGKYEKTLYERLLPVLEEELENEKSREKKTQDSTNSSPGGIELDNEAECNQAISENLDTFRYVNDKEEYDERNDFESYELREGVRGKALIFSMVYFFPSIKNLHLTTRDGGDKDEDKMKKLFEDLGFETEVFSNVKSDRLQNVLMQYNKIDHSNYDAFICCTMSHGNLGEIYTSDGLPYQILDIVDHFSSTNCPSLSGKPKLFFFQSCQGISSNSSNNSTGAKSSDGPIDPTLSSNTDSAIVDNRDDQCCVATDDDTAGEDADTSGDLGGLDSGIEGGGASTLSSGFSNLVVSGDVNAISDASQISSMESNSSEVSSRSKIDEKRAVLVPGEPDVLMSYASLPGMSSYREVNSGALYIDALVENLQKKLEIDRALKKVTEYVAEKRNKNIKQSNGSPNNNDPQLPFHLTTAMSKLLYLHVMKD